MMDQMNERSGWVCEQENYLRACNKTQSALVRGLLADWSTLRDYCGVILGRDRYFFASGFQFRITVMGEAASSVMVFIRNR